MNKQIVKILGLLGLIPAFVSLVIGFMLLFGIISELFSMILLVCIGWLFGYLIFIFLLIKYKYEGV